MTISFIDRDGDKISVKAKMGDSLLDVAKDNDIDLEGIVLITGIACCPISDLVSFSWE